MKYTILGFGARGSHYANLFAKAGNCDLISVCEMRTDRLKKAGELYKVHKDKLFSSEKEFFAAGKLGELCVISTQDEQHMEHALAALDVGYDLLLEKPIDVTRERCRAVYEKAKKLNRQVFVCHVLRYAPFFANIKKELDSGIYGRIAVINMTESVAYWHQAHSYVRGNWRVTPPAAPMIIAKCCHDLDIISWFVDGKECKTVSSIGTLGFFKSENAPDGSADRCVDCSVRADCPYDAEKIYIDSRLDKGNIGWPVDVLCEQPTREKVLDAIKTGPYGRCVWKCDNNAVDRQIVNMEFDGGTMAHLTMTAFGEECYRKIHIHCEKGEIFGSMTENVLTCNIFGKNSKKIDINHASGETYGGHGGGDWLMIKDILSYYIGQKSSGLTSIERSMQSHAIGFAAEESRQKGGNLISVGKL